MPQSWRYSKRMQSIAYQTTNSDASAPVMFRGTFAGLKMNLVKEPILYSQECRPPALKRLCLPPPQCSSPGNGWLVDATASLPAPDNERRRDSRPKATTSRSTNSWLQQRRVPVQQDG